MKPYFVLKQIKSVLLEFYLADARSNFVLEIELQSEHCGGVRIIELLCHFGY